ncbi:Apolipoprotein L domain-containing protein 1 Vascular early response gene protein [Channa argus]|uniref:Apolipoprotein L domain-containing protein 1 Vascular early response gene protein n=2 Tax=Channa argus TaxID=215402 RepID=A0A6G1QD23_CHAAH|nr:Apolipoprotein L domain-containing protein 1 Vascular early response gene protein [Channa argus]
MAKDSKNKPAVPPRPMQSLLPSYASLCESSPPQIRPPAPLPPAETLSEPVYSEIGIDIDNCPYLEILPNKENKMIKPPPSIPPTEKRSRSVHSEKEHLLLLTENKDKMKQRWTLPRSGPPVGSNRYSQRPQTIEDADDIGGMLRWLKKVSKPDYMTPSVYGLSIEEEVRSFNQRAVHVSKALRLYNLLMMKRNESLRNIITEFSSISDSLDKMQKKSKTVDIAGGTTGAIGGVTAVVGIALAPMTLGASLIATAVGAGMVASAGGLSAHTAKASEKIVNRTSVEMLVDEYMTNVVDLEHCLDFILAGMNELRRHDIARLNRAGTQSEAVKMAHLSQSVFKTTTTNNNKNLGTSVAHTSGVSSEKLLQAFSKEMDQYFRENGQKLKKMNKSKFSGRVCLLAENLHDQLEYLNHMWELFT